MKRLILFSFCILDICVLSIAGSNDASKDQVLGTWLTQDQACYVTIYNNSGHYYGKITWLKTTTENGKPVMDSHNPDQTKRNQPLMGLVIMRDFTYDGDKVFVDGKIYEPPTGKDYSCKMKIIDNNTLEVRGYVGIPLFGESETWKRVK